MSVISEVRRVIRGVEVLHRGYGMGWETMGKELGVRGSTLRKAVETGDVDWRLSVLVQLEVGVSRMLERCRYHLERELRKVQRTGQGIKLPPPKSRRWKDATDRDRAKALLALRGEVSTGIESSMEVETSGGEKVGGIAVKPLDAANR